MFTEKFFSNFTVCLKSFIINPTYANAQAFVWQGGDQGTSLETWQSVCKKEHFLLCAVIIKKQDETHFSHGVFAL